MTSSRDKPVGVMDASIGVLAGGKSRRMGRDKAFLPLGDRPVFRRVLENTAPLSDDLIVVTNTPDAYRKQMDSGRSAGMPSLARVRLVSDVCPGKGSLGGIYTAIEEARHDYCLVVACDMPFLNTGLLRFLIHLAPGYDVVIAHVNGRLHPLHAVYSKWCLEPILRRLEANELRISSFFGDVKQRVVTENEVAGFDPRYHSFLNMNTPGDYRQLQQLARLEDRRDR